MGRIRTESKIDRRKYWTLFDTGARNTYITRAAAKGLTTRKLSSSTPAILGGKTHDVKQVCVLDAKIEGHPINTLARVIDEIGEDEDGRPIDILFGALSMQEWGIRLDPRNEKLDWSHYSTSFLEF